VEYYHNVTNNAVETNTTTAVGVVNVPFIHTSEYSIKTTCMGSSQVFAV
jgi:hypothetical protein